MVAFSLSAVDTVKCLSGSGKFQVHPAFKLPAHPECLALAGHERPNSMQDHAHEY
jgi:hypothetical protein